MDLSEILTSLEARIAALEEVVARSEKKSSWTAPWFVMACKKRKPKPSK